MYTTTTWVQLTLWVLQNTMRTSTMKGFGCPLPHLLPISWSTVVLEALPTPVQCPGSGTHGVGSWEDSCCCVRKANGGQAMTSEQKTMAHEGLKLVLTCSPCGSCFLLRHVVLPDVYHVQCRVWAPWQKGRCAQHNPPPSHQNHSWSGIQIFSQ